MREEIVEVGPEGMAVRDLAYVLAINEAEVIKCLFMKGVAVSVTQTLARELVEMVCEEFETEVLRTEVQPPCRHSPSLARENRREEQALPTAPLPATVVRARAASLRWALLRRTTEAHLPQSALSSRRAVESSGSGVAVGSKWALSTKSLHHHRVHR